MCTGILKYTMQANTLDVEVGPLETYRAVHKERFVLQKQAAVNAVAGQNLLTVLTPHLARLGLPINADFLFGQYITTLLPHVKLKQTAPLKSFHGGLTSDMLTRGIYQSLKTKWNFYGCDAAPGTSSRYIGGRVDVFNVNSVRATCAAAGYGVFDFCIIDVKPQTTRDLLVTSLFARVVKPRGLVVLRMPNNPADCLDVVAFLALSHDTWVFKSPFAPKYYLFLRSKKIYPEAFVFNYLSIDPRPSMVLGDLDELEYNFNELIKYNPTFNPDDSLAWYMKYLYV
jgi:hypothetical protein